MKANKTKKNNKCSFKNITRKRVLKEHILNKSFDLFNIHYEEPVKKDMAIGLVYFNSAKSKRLLMNFLYTIEKFKMANIPTYTIEMYMKNNFPIVRKFSVGSLGSLKLALAPKIEND